MDWPRNKRDIPSKDRNTFRYKFRPSRVLAIVEGDVRQDGDQLEKGPWNLDTEGAWESWFTQVSQFTKIPFTHFISSTQPGRYLPTWLLTTRG